MAVYENVKKIADQKSLSIAQVESVAGIGNGTIGKWQKGAKPALETVMKVAGVLGCTVDDLVKE